MEICFAVESSWNVMAHGDARKKWSGNCGMEWVASALHTTSEHGVSSITTADAYTSAASSRLNWRPRRFKWTRPFRRKTKSGFCACAFTFQTQSKILILCGGFAIVRWLKVCHSHKCEDQPHLSEDGAGSDLRNGRRVGEAEFPATLSHPEYSEPVLTAA